MEIKNLLLKALAVSAIGCFGSIGMYYQIKLCHENKQKEIAYEKAYKCYEEVFFKLYYQMIINKKDTNRALSETQNYMKQDGFSNAEICRLIMDTSEAVHKIKNN